MRTYIQSLGILCLTLCLLPFSNYAQQPYGSEPSAAAQKYLDQTKAERAAYVQANAHRFAGAYSSQEKSGNNITWIPIKTHILLDSSSMASNFFTLAFLLKGLNEALLPANIQLYHCSKTNYINNPLLLDFNAPSENLALDQYDDPGAMNLYFVDKLYYNGTLVCGTSTYPSDGNRLIIPTFCIGYDKTTVVLHMIGQYFSLYPTHRSAINGTITDELVTRTNNPNCATAGDELCDTPADPRLNRSGVMSGCTYVGTLIDNNNEPYTPSTANYMSYAPGSCRMEFTPQQIARMHYSISTDRAHLNCSKPAPCAFKVTQYPYLYTFENGTQGWELEPFYQGELYGEFSLHSGGTPTPNTGPTAAYEGQNYLYSDADIQPLGTDESIYGYPNAVAVSPCFDFSSMSAPQISFSYHMWGADVERLAMQVSLDAGFTWEQPNVSDIMGDQGNAWKRDTADLSAYAGMECVRVRFIAGILNTTNKEGDIAIDAVKVEDASPCVFDAEGTPTAVSCGGGEDGSITLSFPSPGLQPYTIEWSTGDVGLTTLNNLESGTYRATITDANSCWDIVEVYVSQPAPLEVDLSAVAASAGNTDGAINLTVNGGSTPYSFTWSNSATTQNVQNLAVGNYAVTITDANGCSAEKDVFLSETYACTGMRKKWPYALDFEGGTGLFKQNQEDDLNWRRRSGATPTSNTGPTSAIEGSNYRHIESSGNNRHPDKTAVLTTRRCLDLTSVIDPILSFQYHMYGNTMGSLAVQLSEDGGTTWGASVWKQSGDQGNSWWSATIDLSPYNLSNLRIRLVGTTGSGARSDMAIDDLYIGSAANAQLPAIPTFSPNIENQTDELSLSVEPLRIYPNPASHEVNFRLNLALNNDYQLDFLNSMGQLIKTIEIKDDLRTMQVDINNFPKGLYYILLKNLTTGNVDRGTLVVSEE